MFYLRYLVAIIMVATGVAIPAIVWIVIPIIVASIIIAMAIGRMLRIATGALITGFGLLARLTTAALTTISPTATGRNV
jgi:hypothetical protein